MGVKCRCEFTVSLEDRVAAELTVVQAKISQKLVESQDLPLLVIHDQHKNMCRFLEVVVVQNPHNHMEVQDGDPLCVAKFARVFPKKAQRFSKLLIVIQSKYSSPGFHCMQVGLKPEVLLCVPEEEHIVMSIFSYYHVLFSFEIPPHLVFGTGSHDVGAPNINHHHLPISSNKAQDRMRGIQKIALHLLSCFLRGDKYEAYTCGQLRSECLMKFQLGAFKALTG